MRGVAESPRQWKILLIDDSDVTLGFVQEHLRAHGFDARGTTRLVEFDSLLKNWRPDLILTDVNMPGLTGVELCQRLKDRYETASLPIVLFSTLPDAELRELARECAADGWLSKADGMDKLPEELRLLCESIAW
jgi:two-component system sensor histidine kinase ChiS